MSERDIIEHPMDRADPDDRYKVICVCGDMIELRGNRDYAYINGVYYCVECMAEQWGNI
jgi:hypothetical protein